MFKQLLQFNVSEVSVSSIDFIPTDEFWACYHLRSVGVKLSPSYFFLDSELLFIDLKLGTHIKWL